MEPGGAVDVGNGIAQIRAGRLVALAISGASRSAAAPDVPTLAETFPNTQLVTWIGLVAPTGTPATAIEKLYSAVTEVLATSEIRKHFAAISTEMYLVSPPELGRRVERDLVQWGELIRAAGIQAE